MMIRSLTCELEEVRLEILRKKRGKCCQSHICTLTQQNWSITNRMIIDDYKPQSIYFKNFNARLCFF